MNSQDYVGVAPSYINPFEFHFVNQKLREFFLSKSFTDVPTMEQVNILSSCEDPQNVCTHEYRGQVFPKQQTGQMILEEILLKNPNNPGFFCLTYSSRKETPERLRYQSERYSDLFPLFEFELHGGLPELEKLEMELVRFLGFKDTVHHITYETACKVFQTQEIEHEHETRMWKEMSDSVFLKLFPERTSPFWNMRRNEHDSSLANKIDVILCGQETIGSAERSCDVDQMKETFYTISNGEYSKLLFDLFGQDRVEKELNEFLSLDFFPRSGGGIGITRLIRAMRLNGLLNV